jgi:hypothetical protein
VSVYTPYPKVIFAGATEYADNNIANITISVGRNNIMEQALAGIISIELWTDADTPLDVNLSDSVNVQIQDSAGDYQQIAGGIISDINITLNQYGQTGSVAIYSITAVGALATLQKRQSGYNNFPKQFDGDRVYDILVEAYLTSWNEVSPTLQWGQVPNITTWENFDGTNINLVNDLAANVTRPGDFELAAYNDGQTNALTLAQDAAQSARGVLYELANGSVGYDAYSDRVSYVPIVLTADDLLAVGLRQAAQWSEVVNDVTLTYKNGATVTSADATSQFTYGKLNGSKTTSLENESDAQDQADAYIESRAYPRTYPEELTIPLHSPTVTDATRDLLIALNVNRAVYTQALPELFGGTFDGFIEGMRWNLTRYTADLTLVCSAQSETYPHQIWLQIPAVVTWAGYTPITDRWMDL